MMVIILKLSITRKEMNIILKEKIILKMSITRKEMNIILKMSITRKEMNIILKEMNIILKAMVIILMEKKNMMEMIKTTRGKIMKRTKIISIIGQRQPIILQKQLVKCHHQHLSPYQKAVQMARQLRCQELVFVQLRVSKRIVRRR